MSPQKLKNNATFHSASGCADPKNTPDLPWRSVRLVQQGMKFFYNLFRKKVLSELEKNGNVIFHSRLRIKVELIRENGRNTSNTGSKG